MMVVYAGVKMHWLGHIAGLALVLAMPLLAEIVAPGEHQEVAPAGSSEFESNQGVYVRESAVALEKLALAQRMESHREWTKSADVFQEILENYPDRVVPAPRNDKAGAASQYVSVASVVQQRLAHWPREGLDVYRARYETPASTLLDDADKSHDDFATLHKVLSLYFVTDSAKVAGTRLVDMYFEAGEFSAAAWVADRLIRMHPNLIAERPMMLYRSAMAHHLAGNASVAAERLHQLQTDHADATGVIRGSDVILSESLTTELKVPPPQVRHSVVDSWPMLGGSPDRASISNASGRPGAKLFSVELSNSGLASRRITGLNNEQRKELEQVEQRDRDSGMMLGVMPAFDRGELYFQDGARVYAVSIESGVPLPGWTATHEGERAGQYALDGAYSLPRNQQLSITLTDDSVLAIMGMPDRLSIMMELGPGRANGEGNSEARLVCLDRADGRERWTVVPDQLPIAALKNATFSGAPLVMSDNVYVIGRGGRGMQFEDCYVICLDLDSGAYRWSCYVASASTANQMWGGESIAFDQASHLAYSSGRLYVLSNLGALAAVDAYSGAIEWLTLYPRNVANEFDEGLIRFRGRRSGESSSLDARPWTQNPAIVADGKVFVLPIDSQYILVYDASTGSEIKRIRLADLRNCDTLLAVNGTRMFVSGESTSKGQPIGVLLCFDWQSYPTNAAADRAANAQGNAALLWRQEFSTPIRGRGFVTTDSVFIPTAERLFRINVNGGRIEESYPRYPGTWAKGEGPGNVLVAQDQVIIAGSYRVDVFTDMQVARAKLDAQVAAAPNDPEPRLRYAEVMFVAGQRDLAVQKLDEAIALLGGVAGPAPAQMRNRVFNDALTFARTLTDEEKLESLALAGALFDRAERSASSPAQQVNYRISRARFAQQMHDFARAVALHQEILLDPAMRNVSLSDERDGPVAARTVAERAIHNMIRTVGADCYAPFEQQAAAKLDQARQSGAPSDLLAVAQVYPNSSAAPHALLAAADAYEAAGDARQATQILRRSHFRYPGSQKHKVFEAMARNYLKMPDRLDVAIARLARIARSEATYQLTQPLSLPNGAVIDARTSVTDALSVLQKIRQGDDQLPDFHLPLPLTNEQRRARAAQPQPFVEPDDQQKIGPVDALVVPLRQHARSDRVVAYASPNLSVYEVGRNQPLWTSDGFETSPTQCAWLDDGRLLAWNNDAIVLLPAAGGEAIWKFQVSSLGRIDVVELNGPDSGDGGDSIAGRIVAPGEWQVLIRDNEPAIIANDAIRQRLVIQNQIVRLAPPVMRINVNAAGGDAVEQITHVQPLQERIVIATSTGRMLALNVGDGAIAWQMRPTSQRIIKLESTDDFVVALTSSDEFGVMRIVVLDAFEGSLVHHWQFYPDSGVFPINLVLSGDGMLVYTLADRICGKDLFEPGTKMNYQEPPNENAMGSPIYHGAGAPGQLLVQDGRILAVSDNGQFVRVHSLETGKLIETLSDDQRSLGLKTEANNWSVWLHTAGPNLYALGQQSLVAYNLDHPGQSWSKIVDSSTNENFQDAFIGRDYLVVLDQPNSAGMPNAPKLPQGAPHGVAIPPGDDGPYRLLAFSRAKVARDGRESGLWVYDHSLPLAIKSNQWQAVEGGFYFVTNENVLHFFRGSRQEPLIQ